MGTYFDFKNILRDMLMDKRDYPTMSTTCTAGVAHTNYYTETTYRRTIHYHAARTGRRWK